MECINVGYPLITVFWQFNSYSDVHFKLMAIEYCDNYDNDFKSSKVSFQMCSFNKNISWNSHWLTFGCFFLALFLDTVVFHYKSCCGLLSIPLSQGDILEIDNILECF